MTTADTLANRINNLSPIKISGNPMREGDSDHVEQVMLRYTPVISVLRVFKGGGFSLVVTVDETIHGPLIHASLAHRARLPTWHELTDVRHSIWGPDEDVMMMMPRLSDYVNVHPFAMHLYSCPEEWSIR